MKSTYPWLIGLFACLFVSLQTNALAHSVTFSDNPHEHNGMVCDMEAIAADAECLQSSNIPQQPLIASYDESFISAYNSAPRLTPPGRAPPPRSPPTLF